MCSVSYISICNRWGGGGVTISPYFCPHMFFCFNSHSSGCEVESHYGFDLYFSID